MTTDNSRLGALAGRTLDLLGPAQLRQDIDRSRRMVFYADHLRAVGEGLELPLAVDLQTNVTGDFVANSVNGRYRLEQSNNNAQECGQVFFGDQRTILMTQPGRLDVIGQVDAEGGALGASRRFVVGLCSDHTNAEDSLDNVPLSVWFRLEASNSILIEGDDGSTDLSVATGVVLADTQDTLFTITWDGLGLHRFFINREHVGDLALPLLAQNNNVLQYIACLQKDTGTTVDRWDQDFVQAVCGRLPLVV